VVPLTSIVGLTPLDNYAVACGPDTQNCAFSFFLIGLSAGGLPYYATLDYWEYLDFHGWLPAEGWDWRGPVTDPNSVQFSTLAAGLGNDDRPQLIGLGVDGLPYLMYFDDQWRFYGPLENPSNMHFRALTTARDANKNLQVILIGANDGRPYLIYQSNSTGRWAWWGQLENPDRGVALKTAAARKGHCDSYSPTVCDLQVIGLGASDGLPYLIYQNRYDQSWHWYGPLPTQ